VVSVFVIETLQIKYKFDFIPLLLLSYGESKSKEIRQKVW